MKKNKTMRAAAVLAVGALLSTCLVSGTFAKYVTSDNASDEARVAEFGVKVNPDGTLFASSYARHDAKYTVSDNTVEGKNSAKVVAPGTSGQIVQVGLTGTPEVAVHVSNAATVTLSGWGDDANYYCPLIVTVKGTVDGVDKTVSIDGLECTSMSDFQGKIEAAVNAITNDYAPGTDLSSKKDACPVISWEWKFDKTSTGANQKQDDKKDTALGEAHTAKFGVDVTTTVTQID